MGRNRAVEVDEQVAKRVGPPLLVPGGEVRQTGGFRPELRRVAKDVAVGAVTPPDPKAVRVFLVPDEARLGGVDLEHEVVLPARTDLADRDGPEHPALRL